MYRVCQHPLDPRILTLVRTKQSSKVAHHEWPADGCLVVAVNGSTITSLHSTFRRLIVKRHVYQY